MNKISIVVPCYNEEKAIPLFYESIKKVVRSMETVKFEFIFIDDGSNDETLNILKKYSEYDKNVKYLSFSRNFGKESAIYAGLSYCTGNYVGIMDVDMQDPPQLIKEMYETLIKEQFDCVAARRSDRKGEPIFRSFLSRKFYKLINKISDTEIVDGARDFRLMKRKVADCILEMKEYNRFSKGLFGWVGFKTKWISYENVERSAGETKWSLWKLFKYSLDGIIDFSTMPLLISSFLGILFCILSLIMIGYVSLKTIVFGNAVTGWTSLVCIIFLLSGIQLLCLGILGQYMAKSYMEVKKRPKFIVKESNYNRTYANKCFKYM